MAPWLRPKYKPESNENNFEKKAKIMQVKYQRKPRKIAGDEPKYCHCENVSRGLMIRCDNDLCPMEWFHFSCVNVTVKPKGKWYCLKCRGERCNKMKPRSLLIWQLMEYNKNKESEDN